MTHPNDQLAERLAAVAVELAGRVREHGPKANAGWLREQLPDAGDQFALLFVLAAAIPQNRPWPRLVRWADPNVRMRPPNRVLRPCGTRAAASRHRVYGEPLCPACLEADRAYERARAVGRRAAAKQAAA